MTHKQRVSMMHKLGLLDSLGIAIIAMPFWYIKMGQRVHRNS